MVAKHGVNARSFKMISQDGCKTSGFTGAVIAAPAGTEFAKYHQNSLLGVGSLLTT